MKLVFLGTGAGSGVPMFYCNCRICNEAVADPRLSRTRSAILLHGEVNTLVDVPPDIRFQLIREGVSDLERVLLTHWHYDHFGGLGDLEFYVHMKKKKPIDLYLHRDMMAEFQDAFGYMMSYVNLIQLKPYQQYHFEDFDITPIEAAHVCYTSAFLIESKLKVAYLSDTYFAPERTKKLLRDVDILIVDATFFGKSLFKERRHMTVDEAITFGMEVNAKTIYLTHLSMHYTKPITLEDLEVYTKNCGNVKIAYDGLRIDI